MVNGTTKEELRILLARGFESGDSIAQIKASISTYYEGCKKGRALMIARTETVAASNEGALQRYEADGLDEVEWLTAKDDRLCEECEPYDGEIFSTAESHGMMPAHPNCLLPDNKVLPLGLVAVTRSHYSGLVYEIHTRSGNSITVTPNHPIMTRFGFVCAKTLNKGDYIINTLDAQRMSFSIDANHDYVPTRIEDVFNTLSVIQPAFTIHKTSTDFHGDGRYLDGDIDIVFSDRFLRSYGKSFSSQHISENNLSFRDISSMDLETPCSMFKLGDSTMRTSNRVMGGFSNIGTLDRSGVCESNDISLTTITRSDSNINKSSFNHTSVYFELSRQFQSRFASLISTDEIIEIRNFNFTGHVYDLQSLEQLYICNNILVKNCRCVWLPVIKTQE